MTGQCETCKYPKIRIIMVDESICCIKCGKDMSAMTCGVVRPAVIIEQAKDKYDTFEDDEEFNAPLNFVPEAPKGMGDISAFEKPHKNQGIYDNSPNDEDIDDMLTPTED